MSGQTDHKQMNGFQMMPGILFPSVHGDLKGANILIDSGCRARLADFGLAKVVDESAAGSAIDKSATRGAVRWMTPELMCSEECSFSTECPTRLPSRGTDTYALGMTIFGVITGCHPFNDLNVEVDVIFKVFGGERSNGPLSGFTDQLWELLTAMWLAEYGSQQPTNRPTTFPILDQLYEEVDN